MALKFPKKFPKLKKRYAIIGAFVLVAAVIVGFIKSLNGPAIGTIIQQPAGVITPPTIYVEEAGEYLTFQHPEAYQAQRDDKRNSTALESYNLVQTANGSRQLTVSVSNLNSGKLADNSGYSLRKSKPNEYQELNMTLGGQKIVVMSKINAHFEKAAFLLKGKRLATFALTSGAANVEELNEEFTKILESAVLD